MKKASSRRFEIEQKINAALRALGLTFAEGFRIVQYDPDVSTARWRYYPATGDEAVELGDAVINLPVPQIEMVLRHEFLHRSVYHGFREQFNDPVISNITLDICINRLLFEAYPKEMKEMSKAIYPPESKRTIIALADCSADPMLLAEPKRSLWKFIWEADEEGNFQYLNPASIYFRLLVLHDPQTVCWSPFSDFGESGPGHPESIPERIVRAGSKIAQGVSRKLPYSSTGGEGLDRYSVIPQQIGVNNVEQFLQRINVRTVASRFADKVRKPLEKSISLQPYPMYPTRLGYIYQVFGLTEVLRLYWNRESAMTGERMAIGMYVDVSGSMVEHFPLISGFIDALKDYPLSMFAFDTTVRPVDLDEFSQGKIRGGGGTDFDCVVNNFIDDRDQAAAVIFTDGYGTLSEHFARKLQVSKKYIYVVFLTTGIGYDIPLILKNYARDYLKIEVRNSNYMVSKNESIWKC